MCSYEEFSQYIKYVAFDVISSGKYKCVVQQANNAQQKWALDMTAARLKIIQCRSGIVELLNQLDHERYGNLCVPILYVMHNNAPPTTIEYSEQKCFISGNVSHANINLSNHNFHTRKRITQQLKNVANISLSDAEQDSKIYINSQFSYFFQLVWFIAKLDHIIKTHTRDWLHKRKDMGCLTVAQLCAKFSENDGDFKKMHILYHSAITHITESIHQYNPQHIDDTIL